MSFVEQEDVFAVAEPFAKDLINGITDKKIVRGFEGIEKVLEKNGISSQPPRPSGTPQEGNFIRLTHKQSVDIFGSDKPDIRFDMHFEDFTQNFATSGFSLFSRAVAEGGVVKAMKLEGKTLSRSEIDSLTEVAKSHGAG